MQKKYSFIQNSGIILINQYMKENWLFIKTPDDYGLNEIIQFENNEVKHFGVKKVGDISLVLIDSACQDEKLTQISHQFITPNRISFSRNGRLHKVLSETEFTSENCIIKVDYQKLYATETELTASEIQNLRFEGRWRDEKLNIIFNENLDPPIIQEINKRMNREGRRILLEKLNDTPFLSFCTDKYCGRLFPIKYVDRQKMVLYGFYEEPYEVTCQNI